MRNLGPLGLLATAGLYYLLKNPARNMTGWELVGDSGERPLELARYGFHDRATVEALVGTTLQIPDGNYLDDIPVGRNAVHFGPATSLGARMTLTQGWWQPLPLTEPFPYRPIPTQQPVPYEVVPPLGQPGIPVTPTEVPVPEPVVEPIPRRGPVPRKKPEIPTTSIPPNPRRGDRPDRRRKPHERRPPKRPTERETKQKAPQWLMQLWDAAMALTETYDLIDALHDAIDWKAVERDCTAVHGKAACRALMKEIRNAGIREKMQDLFDFVEYLDMESAIFNVAFNHLEDHVVGTMMREIKNRYPERLRGRTNQTGKRPIF